MVWIKVDDRYDEHPKFATAGPLGVALWLAGMAYCNRNLTDGFIPWTTARTLVSWEYIGAAGHTTVAVSGADTMLDREGLLEMAVPVTSDLIIDQVVHAGLWDEAPGGYQVHDYADYQPTKEAVLAERAAKQAAGRAGGLASAQARARGAATAGALAKSNPVPVPVPVPVSRFSPVPEPSRASLSDEEQREHLDKLRDDLAAKGILPASSSKTNGVVPGPTVTDEELVERYRAVLDDPDEPEWKREAAKTQLGLMGIPA